MKNKVYLIFVLIIVLFAIISCSSSSVERIDSEDVTDLSGYWNDTDVKIIAETLVLECVQAPAIQNFILQNKRLPTVIIGNFRNLSDEHLDTSILSKKFELALINSGKVNFVADAKEREQIRQERLDQLENASEETAKALGYEEGSDFMLLGSVKTIVDSANGDVVRRYIVDAQLIDIETNRKLWVGENSQIKKYISRSKLRF